MGMFVCVNSFNTADIPPFPAGFYFRHHFLYPFLAVFNIFSRFSFLFVSTFIPILTQGCYILFIKYNVVFFFDIFAVLSSRNDFLFEI
jgi:hypothetical protein